MIMHKWDTTFNMGQYGTMISMNITTMTYNVYHWTSELKGIGHVVMLSVPCNMTESMSYLSYRYVDTA